MGNQGWIKLHRKIQDHWIWEDAQKLKWWLDLIILANHQDKKFLLGNELVELKKGEHHTSEVKLSERWSVDRRTVRRFLKLLESDGMVELKKSPKGTTIKVSNYNDYQGFSNDECTTEYTAKSQPSTQQSPSNVPTNKNVKNVKNNSSLNFSDSDMENAQLLFKYMQQNNPDVREPNFEKWANEFRLIRERNKRTDEQIKYLIKWTQHDDFWKTNILSPSKLRKQWDRLVLKVKSEKKQEKQQRDPRDKEIEFQKWVQGGKDPDEFNWGS